MKQRPIVSRHGNIVRSTRWHGVSAGDPVMVEGVKGRQQWVFVAHVVNETTEDEWVEVRGGRVGEAKGRSFRPDVIYPCWAKRGSRLVGLSLAQAPMLELR